MSSAKLRPLSLGGRSVNVILFAFLFLRGPCYYHGVTLVPAWLSDYVHHKVYDGINYPFPNLNDATVEV